MSSEHNSSAHWIPLADLMTGLMMVFMLLTAAFMLRVEQTTTLVVREYEETKADLLRALQQEFAQDLKQWNAELLGDMTIRFKDPTVLFATGSADLRPQFRQVLKDFFPRYITLLTSEKYRDAVKEIRIEGHTSTFWTTSNDAQSAYFHNMELSQARTRSALEYILTLPSVSKQRSWLIEHVTANGLSSSRPLVPGDRSAKAEQANQRVEFRIVTNASERMDYIARELGRQ
ncbi:OmpA/MotB family protein [Delftia acidovorans]|uniref:OmpA/MotB family protein n=1 Tax=Delftia acidovorans TaxID=80866 RepID=UPI00286EBBEC|nr:OmpA family protein [Delftia acidovorans]